MSIQRFTDSYCPSPATEEATDAQSESVNLTKPPSQDGVGHHAAEAVDHATVDDFSRRTSISVSADQQDLLAPCAGGAALPAALASSSDVQCPPAPDFVHPSSEILCAVAASNEDQTATAVVSEPLQPSSSSLAPDSTNPAFGAEEDLGGGAAVDADVTAAMLASAMEESAAPGGGNVAYEPDLSTIEEQPELSYQSDSDCGGDGPRIQYRNTKSLMPTVSEEEDAAADDGNGGKQEGDTKDDANQEEKQGCSFTA